MMSGLNHFLSPPTSASALTQFHSCHEFYRRARVLRQDQGESFARDVGTWVHAVLQAHYEGRDPEEEARKWLAAAQASEDAPSDDFLQKRYTVAAAVASTYPEWAAERDAKLMYHEADGQVNAERTRFWRGLTYKQDLLVEVPPGHPRSGLWVMDHKVTTRAEAQLVDTAPFAFQPLIYCAAVGARGIIYNVIRRSQLRLRKGEAWPGYLERVRKEYTTGLMYSRSWVEIPDAQERAALRVSQTHALFASVVETAQRLQALNPKRDVAWPQNESSCFKWNRPCPFLKYCSGEASDDDDQDQAEGPDLQSQADDFQASLDSALRVDGDGKDDDGAPLQQ